MSKIKECVNAKTKGIRVNSDLLSLIQAIIHVDKRYLSYAKTNANADDRDDQISQLERVFAYELYHQWSLLKNDNLVLNGEIDKLWNHDTCYPDLVLHGGQSDSENNRIVVEIKRECMVKGMIEKILDDMEKLSRFLEPVKKDNNYKKFRNYDYAVFLLLNGELSEITNALVSDKASKRKLNENIICMTYNEKREIMMASLGDLKKLDE